jgi:uncharacterized DUF497 family protein
VLVLRVEFSWDDRKDRANRRKHGISFSLAALVFSDENRREHLDEGSLDEERWITIGLIDGQEIVVVYTIRDGITRLISARGADRYEREDYWHGEV